MKSTIQNLSFFLLFLLFNPAIIQAQPGWYVDLGWEGRTTTMNYAYGTYLEDGSGNRTLEVHRDGFYSSQIFAHIGHWSDEHYSRADFAGLFYLILTEAGTENSTGAGKGKFRNFDDFAEEHKGEIGIPANYNSDRVHPITGGGDIRLLDLMAAWGNEQMKFGAHLGYGFLGANGGSNGLSFSSGPIQSDYIQSFNAGFWEYGINGMYHPLDDVDAFVNLRLSRLSRVNKRFEKRNGLGIELEGHYRLGEGQFQPYATARYQFRSFKKGELEYLNSANVPVDLPALRSHTFGVGIGLAFNYSDY